MLEGTKPLIILCSLAVLIGCGQSKQIKTASEALSQDSLAISNDSLLTLIQYQTFQYFWDGAEPNSGMARERIHMDNIYPLKDQDAVTTGGTGFGLMALLVGIERGFISREQGLERFQRIAAFLETADRFHGVWPHWLWGPTGKVKPFSKKDDGGDLVETAFLIQGLLTVRQYFKDGNDVEKQLAAKIDTLWREVEWDWHTKGGESVLYWHWSPNFGWEMNFPVGGYNECLIMYVLAAASPTHTIDPKVYHQGWAREGEIESNRQYYELDLELDHYEHDDAPIGPLFWAHYSYLGLNPSRLQDKYANYWQLNKNHALAHYRYSLDNPEGHQGYGPRCWGLTSSYSMKGYSGHRPGRDPGVISPTAALSSYAYTPEQSMQMMRFLYAPTRDSLIGNYGPFDAFSFENQWYLPRYLAIDQGPISVMIENHRTGLLWDLFMSSKEVQDGLQKLGFSLK